jgi:hypothetical protein
VPLTSSVYLGNTWEYIFNLAGNSLRGYGVEPLQSSNQMVEIPAEHLWLF